MTDKPKPKYKDKDKDKDIIQFSDLSDTMRIALKDLQEVQEILSKLNKDERKII